MEVGSMTDLSPAAQAVLDAANGRSSYGPDDCLSESRWIAAAALRATAAYMFPNDTAQQCYDRILAIADELEGIKYGTYRCEL